MGQASVDMEIINNVDMVMACRGLLPASKVRRLTVTAVAGSGTTRLVLPLAVVKKLGLRMTNKVRVRYTGGRISQRYEAEGAYVELLGRHGTFNVIVEPRRKTAIIGAIVLEDLDLLVDCQRQKLVPRDSRGAIYEIE